MGINTLSVTWLIQSRNKGYQYRRRGGGRETVDQPFSDRLRNKITEIPRESSKETIGPRRRGRKVQENLGD